MVELVDIKSFNEQGFDFLVKGTIQGLGINITYYRPYNPAEKGDVLIITRPPMTDVERLIHNRWPLSFIKVGATEIIETWNDYIEKM